MKYNNQFIEIWIGLVIAALLLFLIQKLIYKGIEKTGILKEVKETTGNTVTGKATPISSQIFRTIFFVALIFCFMVFQMMGGFGFKLLVILIALIFIYGLYIVLFKKK
ncbi:MAG: hypothetical protein NTW62_02985 [Candidatus Nomurabacteria bacterium]|nr:hypothetical protein [Candidatus Nomurabacteria bacterium]